MLINQLSPQLENLLEVKYGIIGKTDVMRHAISVLMQSAPTDLTVLITGETGTGKDVFANALHGLSKRSNQPFVSVNCGAIPENLLESELFGHEKGAFTSAVNMRTGFFETAHNGTIFLDEIGEMPIGTQVKLLRVLESGEFSRLGSSDIKKIDVRVIAATNRNLEEEVRKGNFRQDLYFRLKNVHLVLPLLSQHKEDIVLLYEYFAKKIANKLKISYDGYDQDTIDIMKLQPWPGNVREFKNIVDTMITLEKRTDIDVSTLRKYLKPALPPHSSYSSSNLTALVPTKTNEDKLPDIELGIIFRTLIEIKHDITDLKMMSVQSLEEINNLNEKIEKQSFDQYEEEIEDISKIDIENMTIEEVEKAMVVNALKKYEGNRRQAAESLGVSERTLYRKITQYSI